MNSKNVEYLQKIRESGKSLEKDMQAVMRNEWEKT